MVGSPAVPGQSYFGCVDHVLRQVVFVQKRLRPNGKHLYLVAAPAERETARARQVRTTSEQHVMVYAQLLGIESLKGLKRNVTRKQSEDGIITFEATPRLDKLEGLLTDPLALPMEISDQGTPVFVLSEGPSDEELGDGDEEVT